MNRSTIYILLALSIIVIFFWYLPEPKSSSKEVTLLTSATVFDGDNWIEGIDVAFEAGYIIEIGVELEKYYPNAKVKQVAEKFIIPGLIDAHTHAWGDALIQAVKFGVTTELDMFTNINFAQSQRDIRKRNHEDIQQADLFSAGTLITAENGHGTEYGLDIETISGPEQADHFVAERIKEGSDYIKIVYDAIQHRNPSIDKDTMVELVRSARKNDKLSVVHISDYQSAVDAIDAGANGLVHSFMDNVNMDSLLKKMQQKKQFVIPTLSVLAAYTKQPEVNMSIADFNSKQAHRNSETKNHHSSTLNKENTAFFQAKKNVEKFYKANILILAGTDAPNMGISHGMNLHHEMELLVQSGLSATQAIKAATANPASAFQLSDRGYIKVGMKADLLLLNDDPRDDIRHTRNIALVYKNGFIIDNNQANKNNLKITSDLNLGDFEEDLKSPSLGYEWQVTTDKMFKGQSIATVSLNKSNDKDFVHINGEISHGFTYPWAGIYLPFNEQNESAVDISEIQAIQFLSKGTPGNYRLLLFSTRQPMQPIEIVFSVNQNWRDVHLTLKDIEQRLLQSVTGIALVAGSEQSIFELSFDNIKMRSN